MLVTEKEAAAKWCPLARAYSESGAAHNRTDVGKLSAAALCVGSRCMAWRWVDGSEQTTITKTIAIDKEPARPEGEGWQRDGDAFSVYIGHEEHSRLGQGQRWRRSPGDARRGECGAFSAPCSHVPT